MQFANSTMKRIRLDRESRPELYCSQCTYRTGGGDCPRHKQVNGSEVEAMLVDMADALCTGLGD